MSPSLVSYHQQNKLIFNIIKANAKPIYLVLKQERLRSDVESGSVRVVSHIPAPYIAGKPGWHSTITWYLSRTKAGKQLFCQHADVTVVTMSHRPYITSAWWRLHRYLDVFVCIIYLHTFLVKKGMFSSARNTVVGVIVILFSQAGSKEFSSYVLQYCMWHRYSLNATWQTIINGSLKRSPLIVVWRASESNQV